MSWSSNATALARDPFCRLTTRGVFGLYKYKGGSHGADRVMWLPCVCVGKSLCIVKLTARQVLNALEYTWFLANSPRVQISDCKFAFSKLRPGILSATGLEFRGNKETLGELYPGEVDTIPSLSVTLSLR